MAQKRLPKIWLLGPLMFLACWMPSLLLARPLSLPPGPLDTNVFNTNGLVLPAQVQFLLRDLQTNLAQVAPFLAMINGSNNAAGNATNSLLPPAPPAVSSSTTTNALPLIYGLGAALENVQSDLQELLPRLAAIVGQTNYSSNSVQTNAVPVPNRLTPDNPSPVISPQIEHTDASINKPVAPELPVSTQTRPL